MIEEILPNHQDDQSSDEYLSDHESHHGNDPKSPTFSSPDEETHEGSKSSSAAEHSHYQSFSSLLEDDPDSSTSDSDSDSLPLSTLPKSGEDSTEGTGIESKQSTEEIEIETITSESNRRTHLSRLFPHDCSLPRHLGLRRLFPTSYHRDYDANFRVATVAFFTNGVWEALDIVVKPKTTSASMALVVPSVFLTAGIVNFIRALWEQRRFSYTRCDSIVSIISDSIQLGIKFASGATLYIAFNTPVQAQLGLDTAVDWLMSGLSAGLGSMTGLFTSVFSLGLANAAYTHCRQRQVNALAIAATHDDIEQDTNTQESTITLSDTLILSAESALGVSVRGFFEGLVFAILANIQITQRISEDNDSEWVDGMGATIDVLTVALLTALTYQLATAVTTSSARLAPMIRDAFDRLTCFSDCRFFEDEAPSSEEPINVDDPEAQRLLSASTMIGYNTGSSINS